MVRFNEALLVGISLLAALVFSKSRGSDTILPTLPSNNPYSDLLDQAQVQAIEKQQTNIGTLENIRQSNLEIAQDILDYEKNISNVKIDQLKSQIQETKSFISQEQRLVGQSFGIDKFFPSIRMQQARYSIPVASKFLEQQEAEVNRVQEEYQTRFGSLSRYG